MERRGFSLSELPDTEVFDERAMTVQELLKTVAENSGVLSFRESKADIKKLKFISEIGYGSFGKVTKRSYGKQQMAVKSMPRTSDNDKMFRSLMDVTVISKAIDCPEIVTSYGYFVTSTDVLLCMELMDICLGRLLKTMSNGIPEEIIAKINRNVVKALHYLKEKHKIIHRDIKPFNILLDRHGNAKLCDFGISRELVESLAHSNQGCKLYMAPERVMDGSKPYDIRSDVWSLGITLIELATGKHPYGKSGSNYFLMISAFMNDAPPRLEESSTCSKHFCNFVEQCLQKEVEKRPKYNILLDHPFITNASNTNIATWIHHVLETTKERDIEITRF